MSRTRPIGASTPPKNQNSQQLPTLLEVIIARYGATLDAEQAREILHVGHSTLNTLTANGRLKCKKIAGHRLFSAVDVFKYIEKEGQPND